MNPLVEKTVIELGYESIDKFFHQKLIEGVQQKIDKFTKEVVEFEKKYNMKFPQFQKEYSLKEGDEVSVMVINVDRKMRSIQLSIKAKDNADQQEAMQRIAQTSERENAGTTSLGALLRAKLDKSAE